MNFNHFLLPNSNKTSSNPDSVFATEHWQLQGASQYSVLIFYKTYAHTQASGTQRISRTLNVISYPEQLVSLSLQNFRGQIVQNFTPPTECKVKNVNNVFQKTKAKYAKFKKKQQLTDVGLNLSDYKFRQENKGKNEKSLFF